MSLSKDEIEILHAKMLKMDDEAADEEINHFAEIYWISKQFKFTTLYDEDEPRIYDLTFLQRVFMTFEFPTTSIIGEYINGFNIVVILLTLVEVAISTERKFTYTPSSCSIPACDNDPVLCPGTVICGPVPLQVFTYIDLACVIVFTIEYVIRVSLCSIMPARLSGTIPWYWDDLERERAKAEHRQPQQDPYYTPMEIFIRYVFSFHGFVDIVSIFPTYYYVAHTTEFTSKTATQFFRVLRLFRLLRTMRINAHGRMMVDLITRTAQASQEAFTILGFYLALVLIFAAAIMYATERGTFTVNSDYPNGAYLRPDLTASPSYGGVQVSPFDSILTALYFVVITMTTVGYGDIVPSTVAGRAISNVISVLSLLIISLAISIITTNFTAEYQKYLIRRKKYQASKALKEELAAEVRGVPITNRIRAVVRALRHKAAFGSSRFKHDHNIREALNSLQAQSVPASPEAEKDVLGVTDIKMESLEGSEVQTSKGDQNVKMLLRKKSTRNINIRERLAKQSGVTLPKSNEDESKRESLRLSDISSDSALSAIPEEFQSDKGFEKLDNQEIVPKKSIPDLADRLKLKSQYAIPEPNSARSSPFSMPSSPGRKVNEVTLGDILGAPIEEIGSLPVEVSRVLFKELRKKFRDLYESSTNGLHGDFVNVTTVSKDNLSKTDFGSALLDQTSIKSTKH